MKVLGLMSGTSLDGIDAALLEVEKADVEKAEGGVAPELPGVRWSLLAFRTRPYSREEREAIRGTLEEGRARELALLHTRMGSWLAGAARGLLEEEGVDPREVAVVGSHGQTVWHEPPREGVRGSSFQLGCPATLAEETGLPVVSDFRARDLAAGGHGAPLVPWADRLLFSSPHRSRALQNLGGMANVTWLPVAGSPEPLLAFDTGPGVALLDEAARLATGGRERCDRDGELARRGKASRELLDRLLAHPFFRQEPPRSTGREVFGSGMVRELVEDVRPEEHPGGWPNLLATLTALTARSIGDAYRRWVMPRGVEEAFLLGGGARNPALAEAIRRELEPLPVRSGQELGMDPDAREAAAFALLAWGHLEGIPANVPEATGSRGPRVLGSWTPGARWGLAPGRHREMPSEEGPSTRGESETGEVSP